MLFRSELDSSGTSGDLVVTSGPSIVDPSGSDRVFGMCGGVQPPLAIPNSPANWSVKGF